MRTLPQPGNKSVIDFAAIGHERLLLAASIDGIDLPEDISIGHFSQPTHRDIFRACVELRRDGISINDLSVTDWLRNHGVLEKVGGAVEITSIANEIHTENALNYAVECVRESWTNRTAAEIVERWRNGEIGRDEMVRRLQQMPKQHEASCLDAEKVAFLSPSEIRAYQPPAGYCLIGDNHIQRGLPFVIGGAPGVGKSRAATRLAICGATGADYFGMQVHRRFRTMILQCENGRVRLRNEYELACDDALDEFVRVSPPPPFGFAFDDAGFLVQLKDAVEAFRPDLFLLDPWNRLARDDKGKEYREAYERILSVLPTGDDLPAIGIVAHTRKPHHDERASGRALLQTLSGSYLLGSIPRSVFVMQHASNDVDDQRRVWTCCKNNDGAEGRRSAWRWQQSEFRPLSDFDWEEFDGRNDSERKTITAHNMAEIFVDGEALSKTAAVEKLMELTGLKKTACYTALALDGKFAGRLTQSDGLLRWKD